MDINYLLFLQNLRIGMNDAWTPFFEWLSHFAVSGLILLPAIIYWCVDKRKGLFIFMTTSVCLVVNSVIKLTACVYRPWIRDARITPAGDAIREATGYSFPSGHTAASTPMLGGTAMCFKEKKAVPPVCVLLILMVAFSRNYLGVHTPQDVLVALTLSAVCLYFMRKLFLHLEEHPEQEDKWLLIFFLVSAAAFVYVTVKPYPMEYVDGKLLVDPKLMMRDGYKDFGQMCALCLGRYVEKHYVRFRPAGLNAKGIAIAVAGLIPVILVRKVLDKVLVSVFGALIGGMLGRASLVLVMILIWPVVIRLLCGQEEGMDQQHRQ